MTIRSALALDQPFTSLLQLHLGTHLQEFDAGVAGSATASARDLGVRSFPHEYRFQGGRLRFGRTSQYDKTIKLRSSLTVAVWEGKKFSLFTHAYEAKNHRQLLAVLDQVRIAELTDGLVLTAKRPSQAPVASVTFVKEVPGLGLLQIQPATREVGKVLPAWQGKRVVGGELFVESDAGAAGGAVHSFVLAGANAVTHVVPDEDDNPERLLPHLAELHIEWTRA
ncbi:hypothetical protein SMC26_40760 [Actinomadura fulvescens]|uniref:hypothetical protein n=1 Tax=Actinomadura fulvescens TaxID=46160 RepID=UPI0031E113F3